MADKINPVDGNIDVNINLKSLEKIAEVFDKAKALKDADFKKIWSELKNTQGFSADTGKLNSNLEIAIDKMVKSAEDSAKGLQSLSKGIDELLRNTRQQVEQLSNPTKVTQIEKIKEISKQNVASQGSKSTIITKKTGSAIGKDDVILSSYTDTKKLSYFFEKIGEKEKKQLQKLKEDYMKLTREKNKIIGPMSNVSAEQQEKYNLYQNKKKMSQYDVNKKKLKEVEDILKSMPASYKLKEGEELDSPESKRFFEERNKLLRERSSLVSKTSGVHFSREDRAKIKEASFTNADLEEIKRIQLNIEEKNKSLRKIEQRYQKIADKALSSLPPIDEKSVQAIVNEKAMADFNALNSLQKNNKAGKSRIEGAIYPSLNNLITNKITSPRLKGIMFDDNGKMKELNGRSFGKIAEAYEEKSNYLATKGGTLKPEVKTLFERELSDIFEAVKEAIENSAGPFTEEIKEQIYAQAWNEDTHAYDKYEYANQGELARKIRGNRTIEQDVYGIGNPEATYYFDDEHTPTKLEREIENAKAEQKAREAEIENRGIEALNRTSIKTQELEGESKLFGENFQRMIETRDKSVVDYIKDVLRDMLATDNVTLEEEKPNIVSLDGNIRGISTGKLTGLGLQKGYSDENLLMEKEDALDAIAREEEKIEQISNNVGTEEKNENFVSLFQMAKKRLQEALDKMKEGASEELLDFIYLVEQKVGEFSNNLTTKSSTQEFSESYNRMSKLLRFSNTLDEAVEEYTKKAQVVKEDVYKRIFEENPELKTTYEESQKAAQKFESAGGLKDLKKSLNAVMGVASREISDINNQMKSLGGEHWLDNIEKMVYRVPRTPQTNEDLKNLRGGNKLENVSWAESFRRQMSGKKDTWQQETQYGLLKLPYGAKLGNSIESLMEGVEKAQNLLEIKQKEIEEEDKKIDRIIEVIKNKYGTRMAKGKESVTFSKGNFPEEEIKADKNIYLKALRQKKRAGTGSLETEQIKADISAMEEAISEKEKQLRESRLRKEAEQQRKKLAKEAEDRIKEAENQKPVEEIKRQESTDEIKEEKKEVEDLNKTYEKHEEIVQKAAEAENTKFLVSEKLSDVLSKEVEKIEDSTEAFEKHAEMVARPLNVEAHLSDKEHYYVDKDTGERIQSVTQYRAKLLGRSNEQYNKDRNAFKDIVEKTSIGSVLSAESLGMSERDFNFFSSDYASSKRGTLVHRAIELLEKEEVNTLEELSQKAQKELAEGIEVLRKDIAKLGYGEDYINLADYANNYRTLLNKSGLTHAQAQELSLGLQLGGEKVAGTMDQLFTLGGGRGLITDIKTTNKIHGFDETFQLSLLKEILIANYKNDQLGEGIRKILDEIDPQKIELAIIHLIEGKAEKIDFGSLNREELATLLQKANRGEVLTEEEKNFYNRQSRLGVVSVEDESKGATNLTAEQGKLLNIIKGYVIEIEAISDLISELEKNPNTNPNELDSLKKQLTETRELYADTTGRGISDETKAELDKQVEAYKKTDEFILKSNKKRAEAVQSLKAERAEQERIKNVIDSSNGALGHTVENTQKMGQDVKKVVEYYKTFEDGKEVIYKKISFIDKNGNKLDSATSFSKALKSELKTDQIYSGAYGSSTGTPETVENKAIKDYLTFIKTTNKAQLEIERTSRNLEDTTLTKSERKGLEQTLQLQKQNLEILKNRKMYLEGNVLTIQNENGENQQINLSLQKQLALEKQITLLNNQQLIAANKIRNKKLKSDNFFEQVWQGFKTSLKNLTDLSFAYTIIGKIRQAFQETIQVTKELDKVLVDLQIATNGTRKETQELLRDYAVMGKEIGRTTQEIASASNDWLRAGYDGKEAAELTKASMYLSTLGMIDSAQATEYLISTMKGWKLESNEVMDVVDKLSAVDIKAAISAGKQIA